MLIAVIILSVLLALTGGYLIFHVWVVKRNYTRVLDGIIEAGRRAGIDVGTKEFGDACQRVHNERDANSASAVRALKILQGVHEWQRDLLTARRYIAGTSIDYIEHWLNKILKS